MQETVVREYRVTSGVVRAAVVDGVVDARGVRYAGPPAQGTPVAFPQTPGLLDALLGPALGELEQAEDASALRIQAPADAVGAPVLLFVHGGGFTTGSGEVRWFDAPDLVRSSGIVLVTASYRLGALGVLGGGAEASVEPLRDLERAARWVHDNIAVFGGDPGRVTIAGDSAGAWFAHALSVLPRTAGLFDRSLLISMPRLAPLSGPDHAARRDAVAAHLAPSRLRDAAVADVLDAQRAAAMAYRGQGFAFAPAACDTLPAWVGEPRVSGPRLHTSALLLITTADESAAFLRPQPPGTFTAARVEEFVGRTFAAPDAVLAQLNRRACGGEPAYEALVGAMTLWQFASTARELADSATVPTRYVRLDVRSRLPRALSPHCFTLPFVFGERDAWRDAPMLEGLGDDLFDRTRTSLQAAVVDFVRDGAGQAPLWCAEDRQLLAVGEGGPVVQRPDELAVAELAEAQR